MLFQGVLVKTRDWNVTAGFNINFNRGKVDKLADNVTGLYGTEWATSSTFPKSDYVLKEGRPVGLVRGLTADGFYTTDDFTYENGVYILKRRSCGCFFCCIPLTIIYTMV